MKNIIKYVLLISVLCACQKETDSIQSEIQNTIWVENIKLGESNKRTYGPLIKLKTEYGSLECERRFTNCRCEDTHLATFCRWKVDFLEVPPLEFEEPPVVYDPCQEVPCGWNHTDPWDVYENIDPLEFGSIKDHLQLEIEQPTAEAFIVALNEELLVAQFYEENQMMGEPSSEPNVYYLNNEIIFEESLAEEIGLNGTIIEPGEYPILYNEENQTYNVIFKVH